MSAIADLVRECGKLQAVLVKQKNRIAELERNVAESGAALREAAAAFAADDRERLRLILCDTNARTRAHTLAVDAERQRDELRAALEWALDILDLNDAFIVEKMGAQCDQRIDQVAKAKARKALEASNGN